MIRPVKAARILSKDLSGAVRREAAFHSARPSTCTLFLTYRCNSQCVTCGMWKLDQKKAREKEIGFSEWMIIIDKLAGAGIRTAEIFGGNVLLRGDLLISVLQYLREKGFTIHLPTNQIGLDDEIAKAIACYADYVYISVDGVDEYQNRIRGDKGASQRAETALTKLLKHRGPRKNPRLICNTTVSKYNFSIIDRIASYASSMHFDEIHFEYVGEFTEAQVSNSIVNGLRPSPYYVRRNGTSLVSRDEASALKTLLKEVRKKHSSKDFAVKTLNIDSLSETNLYEGTIPHKKCYVERTEVTIDPSGNVIICPFINNYVTGNLLRDPLDAIWNNELHRKFRDCQNSGSLEMCAHCILGTQRNPGFLKYMERVLRSRLA